MKLTSPNRSRPTEHSPVIQRPWKRWVTASRPAFKVSQALKGRVSQRLYIIGVDGIKNLLFQRLKRGNRSVFQRLSMQPILNSLRASGLSPATFAGGPIAALNASLDGERKPWMRSPMRSRRGRAWRSISTCARRH
jgi:hypothetical protein